MTKVNTFVPTEVLTHLTTDERGYLCEVFHRFGGYPSLDQVWRLMDEAWEVLGCDSNQMDERVTAFYHHPVWLLNGLFIEQHAESLEHRHIFTAWVVQQEPSRVADFGGGFGGLARFIGKALPNAQVEVVEPHPHAAAVALAADTPNVRFVPELTGEYDVLIATDVFEHVPDPLGLCAQTATRLKVGGQYLIANCFAPVIKCHLPQLFYFNYGWDPAMRAMGLIPCQRVSYGRVYRRNGSLDLGAAYRVGERARRLQPFLRFFPKGHRRFAGLIMHVLGNLI